MGSDDVEDLCKHQIAQAKLFLEFRTVRANVLGRFHRWVHAMYHDGCLGGHARVNLEWKSQMSSVAKALSARKFFGRRGPLSEWHANYEFRQGQLEMAEAIEEALRDKRHLLVDAGTG